MFSGYLPEGLYKAKPYLLLGAGVLFGLSLNNGLAYFGGGVLVLASVLILKMRSE